MPRAGLNQSPNRTLCFICSMVFFSMPPLVSGAEDNPALPQLKWTHDLGAEVKSVYSPTGPYLFATTADTLYALRKDNGGVGWKQPSRASSDCAISPSIKSDLVFIPDKEPFPVNQGSSYLSRDSYGLGYTVVDYADGLPIWNTSPLGEAVVLGCYVSPDSSLCLVILTDISEKPWMAALNLKTGATVWEQRNCFDDAKPKLFRRGKGYTTVQYNPNPVFDSDSTVIVFFAKNKLQKHLLRNGELIWQCKVGNKYDPNEQGHADQMVMSRDRQTVYVPCKTSLWAVRVHDGVPLWPKPAELKGESAQVQDVAYGVIVRTSFRNPDLAWRRCVTLLNHETGKKQWKKDFLNLHQERASNFVVTNDSIFIWSDNKLFRLSISDGMAGVLADVDIEGLGLNVSLSKRDDGFLVLDEQNASLVKFDGTVQYRTYFKPPQADGTTDFLEGLTLAIASVAGAALANVAMGVPWDRNIGSAALSSMVPVENQTFNRTLRDVDYVYMAAAKVEMPPLPKAVSDSLPYYRTATKPGIVKVDLRTGDAVAALPLGDKTPMYDIAPEVGLLFYVVKDDKDKTRHHRSVAAYAM